MLYRSALSGLVSVFQKLGPALAASLWLSVFSCPASPAQNCASCPPASSFGAESGSPEFSLTKHVNEVNLLFIATRHGQPVSGLSRDDISLLDDNKPPTNISDFRSEKGLPLRVGMVIDISGSITPQFRFEQKAAGLFLRQVVTQKDDQGFVLGFANHTNLTQDFASDPELLAQGVLRLRPGGGTALFDAVHTACEKMVRHEEQAAAARVLVVLSDGENNTGQTTLQEAIAAAQEADVIVYTISTNYPGDRVAPSFGHDNLRKLAENTGGRFLFPSGPSDLAKSFTRIGEELRSRYSLSYVPADFNPDGRYRRIRLEARFSGSKVKVRARKGYYARLTATQPAPPPPTDRPVAAAEP